MNRIAALALGLCLLSSPALARQASPPPQLVNAVDTAKTLADGQAFMVKNAKAPGVITTASGLQYKITTSGPKTGPSPKLGDIIKVHYEGKLLDGTVFDSSFERGKAAIMPSDGLIPGWMEALPLMHVGDEWTLWIPASLGYGEREAGPIPANSVLVFRLQLIGMLAVD
ncbi:MAG: FKBP-type peptidyl-prolyl cis-trans isomerase [Gemmatimonadaceae bacterium]|nr:FKBP-type peptidyl-prolyl cis-trans isomerase [Caulobacter sp.]